MSHHPTFTLPQQHEMIKDRRIEYDYLAYREAYKKAVGLYPEFDCVNHPTCAVLYNYVIYPDDVKKALKQNNKQGLLRGLAAGVLGGLVGTGDFEINENATDSDFPGSSASFMTLLSGKNSKIAPLFQKSFKQAIQPYRFLYSAVAAFDIDSIDELEQDYFVNESGLGYCRMENGMYAEGLWIDRKLSYGLCYNPEYGLMAGSFENNSLTDGVWYGVDNVWRIGKFNQQGEFECQNGIRIFTEGRFAAPLLIQVGNFSHSREDGFILEFEWNAGNVVHFYDQKYNFGEEIPMSFAEKKARKKLYGSSKGDRILAYYRSVMFVIVTIAMLCMSFASIFAFPFAILFGVLSFFSIRSAKKMHQNAKELDTE